MFTYGYIREATMAHLDIDETEAEAMHLLSRFHIYANEAMQAICASKPMYKYIDITVVEEYEPLVMDGSFLRPATDIEIHWKEHGIPEPNFANEEQTANYYHERGIYKRFESYIPETNFICFADKKPFVIRKKKPTVEEILNAEAFGTVIDQLEVKQEALLDIDFSYIGKNKVKFYKTGRFLIPGRFLWFRFDSGISDTQEIDMPSDILLTIPLYIASVCLQIDNMQKAQIIRQQFETALARCTATDFMPLNDIKKVV